MNLQPDEFYERIANRVSNRYTEESLNKEFRDLEVKYNKNITAETELERRSLLGQEHPEVYRRLKAQFQAQRTWIKERKESISEELAQLDYHVAAIAMLQEIRSRVSGRLMHELSQDEWRELFTALNLEIHVRDRNNPATWPETESENSEELPETDIRWGLPLKAEAVSDIVFKSPCPSSPSKSSFTTASLKPSALTIVSLPSATLKRTHCKTGLLSSLAVKGITLDRASDSSSAPEVRLDSVGRAYPDITERQFPRPANLRGQIATLCSGIGDPPTFSNQSFLSVNSIIPEVVE